MTTYNKYAKEYYDKVKDKIYLQRRARQLEKVRRVIKQIKENPELSPEDLLNEMEITGFRVSSIDYNINKLKKN